MDRPRIYEKTAVIGERAHQLKLGEDPLIYIDPTKYYSCVDIATEEYNRGVIDTTIVRKFPNGDVNSIYLNKY